MESLEPRVTPTNFYQTEYRQVSEDSNNRENLILTWLMFSLFLNPLRRKSTV
jgi:hypothetical protein